MTIDQAIATALEHHRAGQLPEAEKIYRDVLLQSPGHPDALHLLGVIAHQTGHSAAGVEMIRRAIARRPDDPIYHCNLGEALRAIGQFDEAIAAYTRALQLQPAYAVAANNLGIALYNRGRFDEAVIATEKAIELLPTYAEAYSNLANILKAQSRFDAAEDAYQKAIKINPNVPQVYSNYGILLSERGKTEQAIATLRRAIELKPVYPEAYNNLGTAFNRARRFDEAIAAFSQAITLQPTYAQAHSNLGVALLEQGRPDEARAACERAIELAPKLPDACTNLGNALRKLGKLKEAADAYRRAIALQPAYAEAYTNLGSVLFEQGNADAALEAYAQARAINPNLPQIYANEGIIYTQCGKPDEAMASCKKAIELRPDDADSHNNLANALKDQGRFEEAMEQFQQAMLLGPGDPMFHSNFARMLHYQPGCDAATILRECRRWDQKYAQPLKPFIKPHANTPEPDRRLKIGYISPDFRMHPVARFMLPLLSHHNHEQFEIHCYTDVRHQDEMSDRIRVLADQWRSIVGRRDEEVAELIRQDGIDILVDLAMHTGKNRLLVFARKPAPVQACYLAYCSTTGVEAIDYRFTDPYHDPYGTGDENYSEESIRLPNTFWCYEPGMETPNVAPLPAGNAGYITFGCLNNFAKISAPTIATWCNLLRRLPAARLLIHAREGSHRKTFLEKLSAEGIDASRVRFAGFLPAWEYFQLYQEIDIALDPFPCAGGTTTCDALWMGVPVVTLGGLTTVARAGVSLLSNVGLPEMIAHSEEQYVQIAEDLAKDLPRLAKIRATLRDRMRRSPLMDAITFARDVEAAYRMMWRRWCETPR